MGSKAGTTLADEGTRKGAPTNYFGTPSDALFSGFRRLCQAPTKQFYFTCCGLLLRDLVEHEVRVCLECINGQGRPHVERDTLRSADLGSSDSGSRSRPPSYRPAPGSSASG